MKIKLMSVAISIILAGHVACAEEPKKEDHFTEHKAQMLKDLTDDKAAIDQVITCVNSAQKRDDMKKCYALKKANIEKIRERNKAEYEHSRAKRKENLQNALKKLDEEDKGAKKQ